MGNKVKEIGKNEGVAAGKDNESFKSKDLNGEKTNYDDASTYFEQKILVPPSTNYNFTFKRLWLFMGPGFLMSIAYLDPGNIESDLRTGAMAQFKLLWVLLLTTIMGLFMQRLSARIGMVTGLHLAEVCHQEYSKVPRIILWIMVEIAIIGSDMQEVIGTAIAIFLLSLGNVPLWAGVLITIVDVFMFLLLDKFGLRKLEAFFAFLIAVMVITFGYQYVVIAPNQVDLLKGMFMPYCEDCNGEILVQAVGIVGCVIMPHNLYLYSALVKSRHIDRKEERAVRDALRYVLIESTLALSVSFLINVMVVAVFAEGLHDKTNDQIYKQCLARNTSHVFQFSDVFQKNNTESVDVDLFKAGIFLGCGFKDVSMFIWAIGILASGQCSTMTGTYTGQFVMEGFLNLKWSRWKRILFTRSIAIFPPLLLAKFLNIRHLTGLNDSLNVLQSLQLPFAIIPLITFSSSPMIMKNFADSIPTKIISIVITFAVIGINIFLVIESVIDLLPPKLEVYIPIGIGAIFYLSFVFYLTWYYFISLGWTSLEKLNFCCKKTKLKSNENNEMEAKVEDLELAKVNHHF